MSTALSTLLWEIANFLIITAVLYKLLYKPLRRFIHERQERIDRARRAAAEAKSDAEAKRQEYERKLQELLDEEKATVARARARADEEAQVILQKTRDQAKAAREAATRRIEKQVADAGAALRDQVTQSALAMVGRVAASAGAAAIHAAAVAEVDRLLGEVPEDERRRAGDGLREADGTVTVAAAPALGDPERQALAGVLQKHLGVENVNLKVEETPDLVAGVEVRLKNLLVKAHWRDRLERFAAQDDGGPA